MSRQGKRDSKVTHRDAVLSEDEGIPAGFHHQSAIELDEEASLQSYDINLGGKRMGGHSGGDFDGGGRGPALGETHPADNATADRYGSREETNAALEEKIANMNSRRLHEP